MSYFEIYGLSLGSQICNKSAVSEDDLRGKSKKLIFRQNYLLLNICSDCITFYSLLLNENKGLNQHVN